MAIPCAAPGEIIDIRSSESSDTSGRSTLAKTDELELIRLTLRKGRRVDARATSGLAVIQCLEGSVRLSLSAARCLLTPGQLVYLAPLEPHALMACEDSSVLVTLFSGREMQGPELYGLPSATMQSDDELVDEASRESFPASDPPARTPVTGS